MVKRFVVLFVMMCAVCLVYGEVRVACAQLFGPPVIPQLPQLQPLPQPPQQIQTLPNNYLQPTLKALPSAPQVVTGSSPGDSGTVSGKDDRAAEPPGVKAGPTPVPVREPVPPPVEKPTRAPAPEPPHSKTPWVLVAGVVAAAFLLGRRTR